MIISGSSSLLNNTLTTSETEAMPFLTDVFRNVYLTMGLLLSKNFIFSSECEEKSLSNCDIRNINFLLSYKIHMGLNYKYLYQNFFLCFVRTCLHVLNAKSKISHMKLLLSSDFNMFVMLWC
jgi:hypothetical protein